MSDNFDSILRSCYPETFAEIDALVAAGMTHDAAVEHVAWRREMEARLRLAAFTLPPDGIIKRTEQ